MKKHYFDKQTDIAWCPGCGNFGLRNIMMEAYAELGLAKKDLVMVSGIGQAAKSPQYYDVSYFNGLHGRALPVATGIKAANPGLTVVVQSGDGDIYGEGGNHLVHAIRRNPNITVIVHNNMIYGLTKGQASPTSPKGLKTPVQIDGVTEEPLNPLSLAIALGATFVARASVGKPDFTKEIIKKAIMHNGFSLVDVFQGCVSFNKVNSHKWFEENTYVLPEGYNPDNKVGSFEKALESSPWPLGIIYLEEGKPAFEDTIHLYAQDKTPLYRRQRDLSIVKELLKSKT
jgi:2-oxoglutarate ferredoxin oxidoreductase subunit beta